MKIVDVLALTNHREAAVRFSSADWFKAGVARQRAGLISLGIAPRTCTILSKLLLLLLAFSLDSLSLTLPLSLPVPVPAPVSL